MTLEAFADTFVPGEKRSPDDVAIAGVASGGGAVVAGAIELLEMPATGVADGLDDIVSTLNDHASSYAADNDLTLDDAVPAFVALDYEQRSALMRELTAPDHPEKEFWVLTALFCFMAFDTAAHMNTVEALESGHPGLTMMGFAHPDPDGLWRFPDYSYGRQLARAHPATTPNGDPS